MRPYLLQLFIWLVFGTLTSGLVGCMVLPFPNARVEGSGIKSRVVDASTGQPISNAIIRSMDGRNKTKSNEDGRFYLPPHIQWHAGYAWCTISMPIWPTTYDVLLPGRSIEISADGYRKGTFHIRREDDVRFQIVEVKPSDALIVGTLKLDRNE